MGDLAERQQRLQLRQSAQFALEKRPARSDFGGERLVFRRHAAHGIGNAGAAERVAVIGTAVIDALGQPEFAQGGIEQVTGIVAGEWPSGPVRATQPGRQARRSAARAPVGAERRHRAVEPIRVFGALRVAEAGQAGAARAIMRRYCPRFGWIHSFSTIPWLSFRLVGWLGWPLT